MLRNSHVLVLDDESNSLGELSLDLVRRHVPVLYAADLDELVLLSRDAEGSNVVALAPNELALGLCRVAKQRFGLRPTGIVAAGPMPSDETREALEGAGIRWHLWRCKDSRETHYVINAAVLDHDPGEIRFEIRAPCQLEGSVTRGSGEEAVTITDLARGGLCTFWSTPPAPNDDVDVAFQIDGQLVRERAKVAWVGPARMPQGWRVGLSFGDSHSNTEELLGSLVSSWVRAHQLGK